MPAASRLDEHLIASLKEQGARIDLWGVGTRLVTGGDQSALGGVYKLGAVRQWVQDFTATGQKLVIFAHHTDVVRALADEFADGCVISGETSTEDRQRAVDRFQNDPAQRVIVCNLKAGGVGLTLTAASDVLFVEQGWTPADMDQAADRCHRIGQQDSVTAWNLLAAGTIDEDVADLIAQKRVVVDAVTDGIRVDGDATASVLGDLLVRLATRGEVAA